MSAALQSSSPPLTPADVARLLERTSRTFALTIPLLDEPLRTQVGLAYLLFRIADTLEDAPLWGRDLRASALRSFAQWLEGDNAVEWKDLVRATAPTKDAGCIELLDRADDVLNATKRTGAGAANAILTHTKRTTIGMTEFVERQDETGGLTLHDVGDLKRYCYAVAGIVGELLTELFVLAEPSSLVRAELMTNAAAFGEALQLVNILKDARADSSEGRSYLPPGVARADIFELARKDLTQAAMYIATLRKNGASRGAIAFCELPVRLASATLDRLIEGAAKLSREEVGAIYLEVTSHP